MHVDSIGHAPLLDGLNGVQQTLAQMAGLIRRDSNDLRVRNRALEITQDCGGHEFECEIDALFYYVRDQITYRRDPVEQERVQDAPRTLFVFRTGDCDDLCVCLGSLLGSLGHRTRLKVHGTRRGSYSHVYLEVQRKDGTWKPLDCTPEQAPPGWEARGHAATYEIFTNTSASPMLLLGGAFLLYWLLR